jgi:carbamoyl-phosphate synthase small subunit
MKWSGVRWDKDIRIGIKNFSFNSRADSSESLEDYFIKQNLICISDVDTRALVSYIRDNGAMNAVICTDGTSIDL